MKSKSTFSKTIAKYITFGFILSVLITFSLLTIFFEPTHEWEQIEHQRAKINIDIFLAIFLNLLLTILTCGVFFFKLDKLKSKLNYRLLGLFGLPMVLILTGVYFNRKDHDDFISYTLTSISFILGHVIVYCFNNKTFSENETIK